LRAGEYGQTEAAAEISGVKIQEIGKASFNAFVAQTQSDELQKILADWDIKEAAIRNVPAPQELDAFQLVELESPVPVGQFTQVLRGSDIVERSQKVAHACSSDAEFAGNPDDLASFVVLRGTIKSTVTTTRTVTERFLELTTEDQIVLEMATLPILAETLSAFPEVTAALRKAGRKQSDEGPEQKVASTEPLDDNAGAPTGEGEGADEPEVTTDEVGSAGSTAQSGETSGQAEGLLAMEPDSWTTVFSLLAGLCAIILALLYLPRLRPAEIDEEGTAPDDTVQEPAVVAQVNAPIANDNGPAEAPTLDDAGAAGESGAISLESLQSRIDFLESVRTQAASFYQQIEQTIKAAHADIGDTARAKEELQSLRALAKEIGDQNAILQEQVDRYKAELAKASEQALVLKQKTADMGVRLAKATAIAETSQSIISELESASDAALSLNAEYRDRARAVEAGKATLKAELDAIKADAAERQELLERTVETNEELEKALIAAGRQRETLSRELQKYKSEHAELMRSRTSAADQFAAKGVALEDAQRRAELRASSLQEQLEAAIAERKNAEAEAQTLRKQGTRMRVEYGVRAKLLEDNVRALGSHIDELEELLRRHQIEVPTYLNVANIFDRASDAVKSGPSDKVLQFDTTRRKSG
jgi:hypothetical protein